MPHHQDKEGDDWDMEANKAVSCKCVKFGKVELNIDTSVRGRNDL